MFTATIDTLFIGAVVLSLISQFEPRINQKIGLRNTKEVSSILVLVISLYFLYPLYEKVSAGVLVLPWAYLPGGSCLVVDMLSIFMAFIFISMGLLAAVYSVRYMANDTGLQFYTLLVLTITGMVGVAFAGDFFSLFIFWELMCLTSYVLVAYRKETWEPLEATFKYFTMSGVGVVLIVFAMSLLYGVTGSLNFAEIAKLLSTASTSNPWLVLILILFIVGFGIKATIVPFHTWAPDAYAAAPSPISSILSGAANKSSIYVLLRLLVLVLIFAKFHWLVIVAMLSAITMTVANVSALMQQDIKRLLAYSSVAQIGYILVGFAAGNLYGYTGTVFYMFNEAFMKGLAFLCAGILINQAGTRSIRGLSGYGRVLPLSSIALSISLLSLAGVPPFSGFMCKLIIFLAAFQSGMAWLALLVALNSAFSLAYYLPIILILFQSKPAAVKRMRSPITMLIPILFMVGLIVLFGVWPDPALNFAKEAVYDLTNRHAYISSIISEVAK